MKSSFALLAFVASFAQAQQVMIHGGVPAVSPDGLQIAFLSNRSGADELSVISTAGTGERQLTPSPEDKSALAGTADGKQILLAAYANNTSHLYAINLDGTKQQQKLVGCPARSLS